MIKRFSLLALTALLVTSLNSCAVIGGLIGAVTRIPGSLLGALTDATETPEATVEPTLENALASEPVSVVVAPIGTVE
ncbi:MAG: hypothetical protein ACKVHP_11610 [Verrucomicrobiales bacterium]|jgi:hypothetical protein